MLQKKGIIFKESVFKVALLIFSYPNKVFHIRELSKETGLSTTSVISAIKLLEKLKVILVKKTDLTTNIRANFDSESYVYYKRIFNLYMLHHLIEVLLEIYKPKVIVLFGSFAKGEDIEESDIDLLILSNEKTKGIDTLLYEKTLKRKLNLHILKDLSHSSNEFRNAVANGVVLHGYLKVI